MARSTFFSFHYKPDNWRASVVRNSWVTQERQAAGFFDSAAWEEVKKRNDSAIEKWIDSQLSGTSVTVVLIGTGTYGRKWINYEILSSHRRGNGLLGIYVHGIKDKNSQTSTKGLDPFGQWTFKNSSGNKVIPSTYDWVADDGYTNMGRWIESAAKAAGR
jgi:hypothetical protein